jgi:hypothetical protein
LPFCLCDDFLVVIFPVVVIAKSAAIGSAGAAHEPEWLARWRGIATLSKGWIVTSYSPYSHLFTIVRLR